MKYYILSPLSGLLRCLLEKAAQQQQAVVIGDVVGQACSLRVWLLLDYSNVSVQCRFLNEQTKNAIRPDKTRRWIRHYTQAAPLLGWPLQANANHAWHGMTWNDIVHPKSPPESNMWSWSRPAAAAVDKCDTSPLHGLRKRGGARFKGHPQIGSRIDRPDAAIPNCSQPSQIIRWN